MSAEEYRHYAAQCRPREVVIDVDRKAPRRDGLIANVREPCSSPRRGAALFQSSQKITAKRRYMRQDRFVPPSGAFTRSVTVRFSHCDPAGIVYFPHYFDMFNGLIEDWYGQELGYAAHFGCRSAA